MPEALPAWETEHDVNVLRRFSRIKLVALDVDGTLQSQTFKRYQRLNRQNRQLTGTHEKVALTIATGRTMTGVQALLRSCPFLRRVPMILYNGSVIADGLTMKVLRHQPMPADALPFMLDFCEQEQCTILAYFLQTRAAVALMDNSEVEYVLGWSRSCRDSIDVNGIRINWQSEWTAVPAASPTAILIDAPTHSRRVIERIRSDSRLTCTTSGSGYIEMRASRTGKGSALSYIADLLGITAADVVAVGDNDNDADMLEWAGIGVAVSNASMTAKAASDFICRRGVAEGVVELLRLISQAKRYFPDATQRDVLSGGAYERIDQ